MMARLAALLVAMLICGATKSAASSVDGDWRSFASDLQRHATRVSINECRASNDFVYAVIFPVGKEEGRYLEARVHEGKLINVLKFDRVIVKGRILVEPHTAFALLTSDKAVTEKIVWGLATLPLNPTTFTHETPKFLNAPECPPIS